MKRTAYSRFLARAAVTLLAVFSFSGARAQETLTVNDGTATSKYVPMFVFYFDDFTRAQTVFPAEDLAEMNGGTITAITFYTTASNIPYTTVSPADIYLTEVESATISAYIDKSSATTVCTGTYAFVSDGNDGGMVTITLTTPYVYNGGNLLFGCDNSTDSGYKDISFKGISATDASISGSNGTAGATILVNQRNFLPKTTFTYEPANNDCPKPKNFAASNVTGHTADLSWESDGTAFHLLYKKASDSNWTEESIDGDQHSYTLTGLDTETEYQAMVAATHETCPIDPETGHHVFSDYREITFTTDVACPVPTGFAVAPNGLTAYTATLTWEGFSDEYQVRYRTPAYVDGVEEGFSSNPAGWSLKTGTLNTDGTATLSGNSGWNRGTNNGVFDIHIYMNMYSNRNCWLIAPSMEIQDGYALSFDMAYTAYSGTQATPKPDCPSHRFAVLISTDDMQHWTILREWNNNGSEYVLDQISTTGENSGNIDLSAYAGQTAYIAFFGHSERSDYDNNFHFDNVVIGTSVPAGEMQYASNITEQTVTLQGLLAERKYEAWLQGDCGSEGSSTEVGPISFTTDVSCHVPTAITVGDITTNSAVVSWESEAGNYSLMLGDEVIAKNITTNSYTLTSLTPSTYYTVKVKAICGGKDGESQWSSGTSFYTACDAVTTFPWSDDFESYQANNQGITFNNPCWVNEHISGPGSYFFEVYSGTTTGGNSTKMLRLHDMTSGTMTKLVLPEMTLPGDNYMFSIDVFRNTSDERYSGEGIRVFVSTDGEIKDATELAFISRNYTTSDGNLIPAESAQGWYTYELPLGISGTCYIILRGESKYGSATYMDNFAVVQAPSCMKPTRLTDSNISAYEATISWTSDADAWQICVNNDEENLIDVTENPYTLTGLTPETPYTVKVRGNCGGGDFSKWSREVSFTTLTSFELANDDSQAEAEGKNSAIIAANAGKGADVTLSGRTLYKDGEWNTICLPFNLTLAGSALEGATAKTLADATMTGTYVTLTFGDAVDALEAGTPYIIKWDNTNETITEPVFSGVLIKNSTETDRTIELADGNVKFIGYYDAFGIDTPANDDIYYMAVGSNLNHTGKPITLRACRAYFQFSEAATARQFVLNFGDDSATQGIISVEDGKLNVESGDWYTVDGVKLNKKPVRKGLYINNGKKVVIK